MRGRPDAPRRTAGIRPAGGPDQPHPLPVGADGVRLPPVEHVADFQGRGWDRVGELRAYRDAADGAIPAVTFNVAPAEVAGRPGGRLRGRRRLAETTGIRAS